MVDWRLYAATNQEVGIKQPEQIFSDICEDADDDDAEINELLAPFITNEAKSKIVHEYAPNYVELYYVDYRDDLCNHLKTFKVVQVRAAYNGEPEYLQLINICLERNMDVIRKAYNEQQKINKRIEEEIECMKKTAMAVVEKEERLPQCTHALMGMAI